MMDAKGVHHGYLGLALMLAALLMILYTSISIWVCVIMTVLGMWFFIDDFIQHVRQRKNPDYRSVLNLLYGMTLYRIPFVKKLNVFIDKIFGQK